MKLSFVPKQKAPPKPKPKYVKFHQNPLFRKGLLFGGGFFILLLAYQFLSKEQSSDPLSIPVKTDHLRGFHTGAEINGVQVTAGIASVTVNASGKSLYAPNPGVLHEDPTVDGCYLYNSPLSVNVIQLCGVTPTLTQHQQCDPIAKGTNRTSITILHREIIPREGVEEEWFVPTIPGTSEDAESVFATVVGGCTP